MKKLLLLLLFIPVLLNAQEDTTGLATAATDTIPLRKNSWKSDATINTRFDIGLGAQLNSFGYMGTSAGPLLSIRANSKYGRIAGYLNLSYNLNNNYDYYHPEYGNFAIATNEYYISHIRYNFLKISFGMQVPLFNRTNKKGFSISWLFGMSYCNGLGSGEYKVGLDKPGAPDSLKDWYFYIPNQSQKFSINNYNMQAVSVDLGLSFTYTFPYSHYQIFADGNFLYIGDLSSGGIGGETFDKNYNNPARAQNIKPAQNFCINVGLRYLPYNARQTKPPKRRNK